MGAWPGGATAIPAPAGGGPAAKRWRDAFGLLSEVVVDVATQPVPYQRVDEHRRQQHRQGDRQRGEQGEPPAEAHCLTQRVPDSAHRLDQPRLAALLGLAAQVADVDLERVRARSEVVAPDRLEELGPASAPGAGGAADCSSSANSVLVSSTAPLAAVGTSRVAGSSVRSA